MSAQKQLIDEIRNRDKEFMAAFNAGNTSAIMQIYDDNCTFMPAGTEPVRDKSKIQEFFQKAIDDGMKTLTLNYDDVQGAGDWAFERGNYLFKGPTASEKGLFIVVWHKVGGKWRIHVDCSHPV